jgi:hypothetical protein
MRGPMTTTFILRDMSASDAEALRRLAFDLRVPTSVLLRLAVSLLVVRAEEDSDAFRRLVSEHASVHTRRPNHARRVARHGRQ